MKEAFNIKYRSQIESGEYKVVTRENRPVEVKIWDLKGDFPVVGVYYDDKNHRDTAVQVTAEGRCSVTPGEEYCDDFFVITDKPDGLEFKQGGWYLCTKTHMFFEEGELYYCHRDGHIDDGCGRAYIGRDGYNIKYFQPIAEIKEIEEELKSLIPDWKKNVKEFKKSALRLLDLAKQDIQKDLPVWKKVKGEDYAEETRLVRKCDGSYTLATDHTLYPEDTIQGKASEYYITVADLERLLKED